MTAAGREARIYIREGQILDAELASYQGRAWCTSSSAGCAVSFPFGALLWNAQPRFA
ncbi:hypothetical protein [Chloracidobacterium thermophilum]|uniref:hypothetical protein n=1 Tax=Chloracidobacterium thermophilum TaxID=458033 RepID=UPI00387ECC1A